MRLMSLSSITTMLSFIPLLLVGCGGELEDEPTRAVVFGTVSYVGEPVKSGEIRFIPAEGTEAPTAGGLITDGKYRIDHKGGVPVGDFKVRIMGYKAAGAESGGEVLGAPPDDPMAAREQYLPATYSGPNSQLTLTVEAGEPIQKDFKLGE